MLDCIHSFHISVTRPGGAGHEIRTSTYSRQILFNTVEFDLYLYSNFGNVNDNDKLNIERYQCREQILESKHRDYNVIHFQIYRIIGHGVGAIIAVGK